MEEKEENLFQESQSLWESQDEQTKSLMAEVLEDKDVGFRAKVLNLVVRYGLSGNDPLFLMLIAIGNLQVMLEEAPAALTLSLEELRSKQEKSASEAVARTQSLVAESVRELIKKTETLQLRRPFKILMPGLALFALIYGLGLVSGIGMSVSLKAIANSGQRLLSLKEASLLDWAKSPEGKYAKQLYEWNKDYLAGNRCQQEMKTLGVHLNQGNSTAISGFCTLWVVPPQARQYK
jgi:DNA polymerase III delta prime subunit